MLATLDDVSSRLGRPITDTAEVAQVNKWIGDVSRRIVRRIPTIDNSVVDGTISSATVSQIVANVVIRKMGNPEGFRSERIDDYYYDRGQQSADLSLTDVEWADLIPGYGSGAFSVRPGFVPDTGPSMGWL